MNVFRYFKHMLVGKFPTYFSYFKHIYDSFDIHHKIIECQKGSIFMKILDKKTTDAIMNIVRWDGKFIRPINSMLFDESGYQKAINFWKEHTKELPPEGEINGDMLLSGICPVYDMLLETTEPKSRGDILYARIMIRPDLREEVPDLFGEIYAGVLLLYTDAIKVMIPFKISGKSDYIIFPDEMGIVSNDPDEVKFYTDNPNVMALYDISNWRFYMELWYGSLWVIMNPLTRVIFKENSDEKDIHVEGSKGTYQNDGVLRYVRSVVITADDFEKSMKGYDFTRHTDAWVVTGHRRTYKKTGKTIYIAPYWKGPLRELRVHKTKQRELIYNEEDGGLNNE